MGDNRAGLLVLAELERYSGADHSVLPLHRRRKAAHPQLPVCGGIRQHLLQG